MRPMLATRGDAPPPGAEWAHEIKWDGIRAVVEIRDVVRITSRTERDMTASYPDFAALAALPSGLIIDGEMVHGPDGPTLFAFDLLECEGQSLFEVPYRDRRRLLEALPLAEFVGVQISPVFDDGDSLLEAARAQGLEGIVSKRRDSLYYPGRRSNDWIKLPINERESFVVAGYRLQVGGHRIGSLVLAEAVRGSLEYRGRVGLSVSASVEKALAEQFANAEIEASPLAVVPKEEMADVQWLEPSHVVDVEFLMRTPDGRLRHPTYRGLRNDVTVHDLMQRGADQT